MRRLLMLPALVLLLLLPASAWAQPLHVQTVSGRANDPVLTIAAPTNGNLCVVMADNETIAATNTISDNGSPAMTWQAVTGSPFASATDEKLYIWWADCGTGGATTVTITTSGGSIASAFFGEFSGINIASPVDQIGSGQTAGTALNITGTVTTTVANELLIAASHTDASRIFTLDGSWTLGSWTDGNAGHARYRIVPAAGNYDAPATAATAVNAITAMVTFKEATPTPPFIGTRYRARIAMRQAIDTPPNPEVLILQPTTADTYNTSQSVLTLSGSCQDNVGCTTVTWTCATCTPTSGTATGTANWSFSVTQANGANTIIVTGTDVDTNTGNDTLVSTYTAGGDAVAPTVTITTNGGANYSVSTTTTSLAGTCSDNVACIKVRIGQTVCGEGVEVNSWTCNSITLTTGANALVITGEDGAGNLGTDSITVTRNVPLSIISTSIGTCTQNAACAGALRLLEAAGGTAPYTFDNNGAGTSLNDADAQCAGLSIATTGQISGTPTQIGVCTFTARVTDDVSAQATKLFNLTINDPNAVETSHTFFDALVALGSPTVHTQRSLRDQTQVNALTGINDATPYWTYVFSTDDYATPKDGVKFTAPPEACKPDLDVARTIVSSTVQDGAVALITLASNHAVNIGQTRPVRITGHTGSTPAIEGAYTATFVTKNAFTVPVDITVGGTGGTARLDRCDCTTEGQERCIGSDSIPTQKQLEVPIMIGAATAVGGGIVSSDATTDALTTVSAHGLTTGDRVQITSHSGVTPSLNNRSYIVGVTGATTFTLRQPKYVNGIIDITVGGTGGAVSKYTSTNRILITWDFWHGEEWRTNNLCNGPDDPVEWCTAPGEILYGTMKTYNIRQNVDGRWWTMGFHDLDRRGDDPEISKYYDSPGQGGHTPSGIREWRGVVPAGGNDGTAGCNRVVQPQETYPIHHSVWTRYWVEIRLNVPSTDPDWACYKSIDAETAQLAGTWHMASVWVADENREPTRVLYKIPVGIDDPRVASFDFEFNTSADAPAKTGTWYGYARNVVILKDYALPTDPESDTVIFKRPVP